MGELIYSAGIPVADLANGIPSEESDQPHVYDISEIMRRGGSSEEEIEAHLQKVRGNREIQMREAQSLRDQRESGEEELIRNITPYDNPEEYVRFIDSSQIPKSEVKVLNNAVFAKLLVNDLLSTNNDIFTYTEAASFIRSANQNPEVLVTKINEILNSCQNPFTEINELDIQSDPNYSNYTKFYFSHRNEVGPIIKAGSKLSEASTPQHLLGFLSNQKNPLEYLKFIKQNYPQMYDSPLIQETGRVLYGEQWSAWEDINSFLKSVHVELIPQENN